MTLLDANVIIAFLDRSDVFHNKAVKEISRRRNEHMATLSNIMIEVYSVIARRCKEKRYNCQRALELVQSFENSLKIIWLGDIKERHYKTIDTMIKTHGALNYNDALLLNFAKEQNAELLTFDKTLKKAFKSAGPT